MRIASLMKTFQLGLLIAIGWCPLTASVSAQSVINKTYTGTQGVLEPFRDTEVATAEMGVVREMFVKLGDVVEATDPIGRLDCEQQRFQLQEAELDFQSTGQLETARSEADFNARRVEETTKSLLAGRASPKELERYQLDLNISKSKVQAQEEQKKISQARLEKARLLFNERTVRAPHHGTVINLYREVGEYIAGNVPAIIRLVDTSKLRARFFLADEISERFRNLEYAEIKLSNHVIVRGKIEFISPFAAADGQVIEMTVLIDNADGRIKSSSCELVPL
jgi:RND family efflux transporter MFP subunit